MLKQCAHQDVCWTVLLFREIGTTKVCCPGELDHGVGQHYGADHACVLHRLYVVCRVVARACARLTVPDSAQMITSAITVGSDGAIVLGSGATYGILLAILFCHGLVCSAATNVLARLNLFYVIVNGVSWMAFRNGCVNNADWAKEELR